MQLAAQQALADWSDFNDSNPDGSPTESTKEMARLCSKYGVSEAVFARIMFQYYQDLKEKYDRTLELLEVQRLADEILQDWCSSNVRDSVLTDL